MSLAFLRRLFAPRQDPAAAAAASLYAAAVGQARSPWFFARAGVPDDLDGRFETIALHAFLVLRRLKGQGEAADAIGQALFDLFFADMDRNLREMGASDMGVGGKVKRMASAFLGRVKAYDEALDGDLEGALRRNLYGTVAAPAAQAITEVAAYVRRTLVVLEGQPIDRVVAGEIVFPPAGPGAAAP